jgi:transcriptional regulator with XRE-family HTH domain
MAQRPRTAEADAFLVAFGRHIRAMRRARGLSQERLGDLTGLDRQTMNRLENAAHAISTAHLGALARALQVPAAELMPSPGDYGPRR